MSIRKCTDLTSEHIEWLVDHYYLPVKVRRNRDVLPTVCVQLESAGLVQLEHLPVMFGGQISYTITVISVTPQGHELAAQAAPVDILQRWGDRLSDEFIEKKVILHITLAALPELLVGDNLRWRRLATKVAKQLEREKYGR